MTEEVRTLRRQRGYLKGRLTAMQNFLRNLTEEEIESLSVFQFDVRLEALDEITQGLDKIDEEILESIAEEELETHYAYCSELDDAIMNIKIGLKKWRARCDPQRAEPPQPMQLSQPLPTSIEQTMVRNNEMHLENRYLTLLEKMSLRQDNSETRHVEVLSKISENKSIMPKLPTLSLPKFNGDYRDYVKFRDNFKALVEKRDFDDASRLQYLQSVLSKEPLDLIAELDKQANGYQHAWQVLENRYFKKRVTVDAHLKTIVQLQNVVEKSAPSLRQLLSEVTKQLKMLEQHGLPINQWDAILVFIIKTKLPERTLEEWNEELEPDEMPSAKKLFDFLETRCLIWEEKLVNLAMSTSSKRNPEKNRNLSLVHTAQAKPTTSGIGSGVGASPIQTKKKCPHCSNDHPIFKCPKFLEMKVSARRTRVEALKLCFCCLRQGHFAKDCNFGTCQVCSKQHNTLLHIIRNSYTAMVTIEDDDEENEKEQSSNKVDTSTTGVSLNHSMSAKAESVLLATAVVKVLDKKGNAFSARALLDSGSQANFMSDEMAKKLRLPRREMSLNVHGINGSEAISEHCVLAVIASKQSNFKASLKFFTLPKITEKIPASKIDISEWKALNQVSLADPKFNEPQQIDMLLGAEIFFQLMLPKQINSGKETPILQESALGWIVAGKWSDVSTQEDNYSKVVCQVNQTSLSDILKRFWEIETPYEKANSSLSQEEKACELHFNQNTHRDAEGRFVVRLPLSQSASALGNSYSGALACFLKLEKRLRTNPAMYEDYRVFMAEYLSLNHMQIAKPNRQSLPSYYMPHHAVVRPDAQTTKLRTVFNASFKSTSGVSLNDIMMVGPIVQDDLISILIRFRLRRYVFTADITKMYRQIRICDEDMPLQKILWRDSSEKPIIEYELSTVTYGTAAASFLATKCLNELREECKEEFPLASEAIQDFYMDDCMTGADDLATLQLKQEELCQVLGSAGFELHKWKSNSAKMTHSDSNKPIEIDADHSAKPLGLFWNPKEDYFFYVIEPFHFRVITKRSILSAIAKLFDPIGFLAPIILKAKSIMRSLWIAKIDWDENPPQEIIDKWSEYQNEMMHLNECRIPRWAKYADGIKFELHGFCDASEVAYGACIYLKCIQNNGEVHANLICSKSRIAPLKTQSIPRLELCAAALLAQLMKKVMIGLRLKKIQQYCWSDSTIVLSWLNVDAARLTQFVRNRTVLIEELELEAVWKYVPSNENPADIISRGSNSKELLTNELWWHGPRYLRTAEVPHGSFKTPTSLPDIRMETKQVLVIQSSEDKNTSFLNRISSFDKMIRIMAYALRFIEKVRKIKSQRVSNDLTVEELKHSFIACAKLVQNETFSNELQDLVATKTVQKASSLRSLNPFLNKGLIRVGGRLRHATVARDQRIPIVLPSSHNFTKAFALKLHRQNGHCGPQTLLGVMRQKIWPIRGGKLASDIVKKCVICFRNKPIQCDQLMGDLPPSRVQANRPFLNVGIDFAGPVSVKTSVIRNSKLVKAYVAVFVCFSTKASHLELVSDLTTVSFLAALKRFVARRGLCRTIHCDNGRNFVGAHNELEELVNWLENAATQTQIRTTLLTIGIEWKFNIPYAPHRGGLWEAAVKSMKFHLKRIVGNTNLTFEMLYTVLVEIEAILNSRPLTPISSDPSDLSVLTPAHFLIGQELLSIPEIDLTELNASRLSKWQLVCQLKQHFWNRWMKEYLPRLQQRCKWHERKFPVKLNDLVLIHEDNYPPLHWPLGRILEIKYSADKLPRSVVVRTSKGNVQRVIQKICVLPL